MPYTLGRPKMNKDNNLEQSSAKNALQQSLTPNTRRKILDAIKDCDRFIAKEAPRDASLRPADMAQHLAYCYTHRETLLQRLAVSGGSQ